MEINPKTAQNTPYLCLKKLNDTDDVFVVVKGCKPAFLSELAGRTGYPDTSRTWMRNNDDNDVTILEPEVPKKKKLGEVRFSVVSSLWSLR